MKSEISALLLFSYIDVTSAQMHLFVRTLQQLHREDVEKRSDDHDFWGRYLQTNSLSTPPFEGMGMMMRDDQMMMMMMNDGQMTMGMNMDDIGVMGMAGAMGMGMDEVGVMGMAMGMADDDDDAPPNNMGSMGGMMELDDVALAGMGMAGMMGMDDDDDAPPMRPMGMGDVGGMGMAAVLRHVRY